MSFVQNLVAHHIDDVAQAMVEIDWDDYFDINIGDDCLLRESVLNAPDLPADNELFVCAPLNSRSPLADCVAILWFRRAKQFDILHFIGVRRDCRRQGVARTHLYPIVQERIRQHLLGASSSPLFALVPTSARAALQFFDTLLVPLRSVVENLINCVLLGPPLGWADSLASDNVLSTHTADAPFQFWHTRAQLESHTEMLRNRAPHLLIERDVHDRLLRTTAHVLDAFGERDIPLIAVSETALAAVRYGHAVIPWNDDVYFALHRATYLFLRNEMPSVLRGDWWLNFDFTVRDDNDFSKTRCLKAHMRRVNEQNEKANERTDSNNDAHFRLFCIFYSAEKHAFVAQCPENSSTKRFVQQCTFDEIVERLEIDLHDRRVGHFYVPKNCLSVLDRCYAGWREKIVVETPHTGGIALRFAAGCGGAEQSSNLFCCRPLEAECAHLSLNETFFDLPQLRKRGVAFCIPVLSQNDLRYLQRTINSFAEARGALLNGHDASVAVRIVFDSTQVTKRLLNDTLGDLVKLADVELITYNAQVALSGLETYVTPCNSAHSRAWFFQYCVQQTGNLSHYCNWPCNALMTNALAQRLAKAISAGSLPNVLHIAVYDTVRQTSEARAMIFAIESKIVFHREFLWECWSVKNAVPSCEWTESDYVLLNSALDAEPPIHTHCWWQAQTAEKSDEKMPARCALQYEHWATQLAGEQLFCRPNDAKCTALMQTLPVTDEHIANFSP